MIIEIKIKFILLSMTMLFILLFCIVAGMNAINYNTIVARADSTLTLLSGNRGALSASIASKAVLSKIIFGLFF